MNREELIEQLKQLATSEDNNKFAKLQAIRRQYRMGREDDESASLYVQELNEQFNHYVDEILAQSHQASASAKETKENVVKEARALLSEKNFKKATNKMNELFNQFKSAGRCSKDVDDQLWSEFKEIKDQFYANKSAAYQEMVNNFENNKQAKLALIEKVKTLAGCENFNQATKEFNNIMSQWKEVGPVTREDNEPLWQQFQEARNDFFAKRKEYYQNLDQEYANRAENKKELITKAKKILANSSFSQEEVNEIKELRNSWKEIGFAGKENEDILWPEFNDLLKRYFDNMKYYG